MRSEAWCEMKNGRGKRMGLIGESRWAGSAEGRKRMTGRAGRGGDEVGVRTALGGGSEGGAWGDWGVKCCKRRESRESREQEQWERGVNG